MVSRLDILHSLPRPGERWRRVAGARRHLTLVLASLGEGDAPLASRGWRVAGVAQSTRDQTVLRIGDERTGQGAILKLPHNARKARQLAVQSQVLARLHRMSDLGGWRRLLPVELASGRIGHQPFVIESVVPGEDCRNYFLRHGVAPDAHVESARVLSTLHAMTRTEIVVDDELLETWCRRPVELIEAIQGPAAKPKLARVRSIITESLFGRTVHQAWHQGDFTWDNILVSPDGRTVTGIIDWELSETALPPEIDLLHLILSRAGSVERRAIGALICQFLGGRPLSDSDRNVFGAAGRPPPHGDELVAFVLLAWLRHLSGNLRKSMTWGRNWLWVRTNIEAVLRAVERR